MRLRDAGRNRTSGLISSRVLRALGAAALLSPVALVAQEQRSGPAGQPYTVKAGDTLWDLAQLYLKDPHLWTEIFKLNKDKIADPHWIYPGQVLLIPGAPAKAEVVVAPEPAPKPVQTVPVQPVPPLPIAPQRPTPPPVAPQGPTVFAPPVAGEVASGQVGPDATVPRTVLLDEYITAPYVVRTETKLSRSTAACRHRYRLCRPASARR